MSEILLLATLITIWGVGLYFMYSVIRDRLDKMIELLKELAGDPFPDDEYDEGIDIIADSPPKEIDNVPETLLGGSTRRRGENGK